MLLNVHNMLSANTGSFEIQPDQHFPDSSISQGLWQTSVRLTAGFICVWSYIRAASTHTITQKQQAGRSLKTLVTQITRAVKLNARQKTPHCPHVLIDRVLSWHNAAIYKNKTLRIVLG